MAATKPRGTNPSGVWSVATASYAPLIVATAVSVRAHAQPLVRNDRDGLLLTAATIGAWLAYAALGLLPANPPGRLASTTVALIFMPLAGVAVFGAGAAAFVLGRLEARAPAVVMVLAAAVAVAVFVFAAAGVPSRHSGIDAGYGSRSVQYLGVFGALAVPILSGPHDFIANKVDGWAGIAVLAGIAAVLAFAGLGVVEVVHRFAGQESKRSPALLALWVAAGFAGTMALALNFRT
jgi:hypothetical protein